MLENVGRFATILRFSFDRAEVCVHGIRQDAPLRIIAVTYTLHLWTAEPAQRVDLLHRNLQKFGTVYNTIAASAHVSGRIEVHPPAGNLA
jgi:hypothetical protein